MKYFICLICFISLAFSLPLKIEDISLEDEEKLNTDIIPEEQNKEADTDSEYEAARNARFNFGYTIQVGIYKNGGNSDIFRILLSRKNKIRIFFEDIFRWT